MNGGVIADLTVIEVSGPATTRVGRMLADSGAHVILVEPDELSTGAGRQDFRKLIEEADILLEGEPPGRLTELGLDYTDLTGSHDRPGPPPINEQLIHVSITPFGRTSKGPMSTTSRQQPMTDLTIKARAGWLGDDGPPSAGDPTAIACQVAMLAILKALLDREQVGGQFIDVSIVAAANVCAANIEWLSGPHVTIPA